MCTPQPTTCLMGNDCEGTHVSAKAPQDHLACKRDDCAHSPSTPTQVRPCISDFPEFPAQKGTMAVPVGADVMGYQTWKGPPVSAIVIVSGQFWVVLGDEYCPLFHNMTDVWGCLQQEGGDPIFTGLCVWERVKEACGQISQKNPQLF